MTRAGFAATLSRAGFVALLAIAAPGIALAVEAEPGAAKSGGCLSGPKGAAPQGERWYYRVERGTKRHCWYTRAEATRTVAAQKPRSPEPAGASREPEPAPQQALLPSVANARAEADLSVQPPPTLTPTPRENPRAGEPDRQTRTLAERWSDAESAGQFTPLRPANAMQPPPQPQVAPPAEIEDQENQLWAFLSVVGFALALASLAVALFVTSARRRNQEWPVRRWQSTQADAEDVEADDGTATAHAPGVDWIRAARETAQQRNARIERLLSPRARRTI